MKGIPSMLKITLCVGLLLSASIARADVDDHEKNIKESTTETKSDYHVVFYEIVKSHEQKDWKQAYNATVEVYKGTEQIGKFRGSTLPNAQPPSTRPKDFVYSVVEATCAFPVALKGRFYTWELSTRASKNEPCLRLAAKVPTLNIGSERIREFNLGEFVELLKELNTGGAFNYAVAILVHEGFATESRGSAGCLTLHPDDAESFFKLFPSGTKGTLELNRGLEDEQLQQSYCY